MKPQQTVPRATFYPAFTPPAVCKLNTLLMALFSANWCSEPCQPWAGWSPPLARIAIGGARLPEVPHACDLDALIEGGVAQLLMAAIEGFDGHIVRPSEELQVMADGLPIEIVADEETAWTHCRPERDELQKGFLLLMRRVEVDDVRGQACIVEYACREKRWRY